MMEGTTKMILDWKAALQSALNTLLEKISSILPNIFGALIILIFGSLIAMFAGKITTSAVKNLKIDNFRKAMKRKTVAAGIQEEVTPDEFFSLKIFLTLGLPLIACIYNLGLNITNPFILIFIFGAMGFFFPDLWIKSLIKNRQEQIRLAIPFVVDLLSLCTEAGLDFMRAIQRVVEKAKKNPLIDELEIVLNELKLGTTRAEALRNMADRINMPEISSLVAVLITADKMGASISTALKAQSNQIRGERFIRAEKAGATASQKILFPLIFFIVPAVFIVVLGPIVAKLLQQLFTGGGGTLIP